MIRATRLTTQAGIRLPIIGGAMYPCSNPELVAAVSAAGGIGIVQPVSLTYVFGHDYREGLRYIRSLTDCPIGVNALIERSSKRYHERVVRWVDIALEEGVRFFVTSLGNPAWVVEKVHAVGGFVYHDVTERKWAEKAVGGGVDGLIAVNSVAGGHAGGMTPERLLEDLSGFDLPKICAGGVGDAATFRRMMDLGYDGVQVGTRFIATTECKASPEYKQAIVDAGPEDIVLTQRLTGVPVAVIQNEYVRSLGTRAGPVARFLLRGNRTKRWVRTWYALTSLRRLKRSALSSRGATEYWQAGKSVGGIHSIRPVAEIVREFEAAL
ncbi:MAG TPA: nitronate monooxygenase, partial [Gemmatimonadaceae bacterium]|nr:nitronate monooxygenase [Gemmatimonadaceae bacterium]